MFEVAWRGDVRLICTPSDFGTPGEQRRRGPERMRRVDSSEMKKKTLRKEKWSAVRMRKVGGAAAVVVVKG